MLMDDHGLVLIRNTDMGCYQDRGMCANVCLCSHMETSLKLPRKKKKKKEPQLSKFEKNLDDKRRWCEPAGFI